MSIQITYNSQGYPSKRCVNAILKKCNTDVLRITLNADYGIKKAGILWKPHSMDEQMKEFQDECKELGIEFIREKYEGLIHSIWFKKKEYI